MTKRPIIGLTGGRIEGRDIIGNLDVLGDSPVDVFYADYSRAVLHAGGIPLFLPLDVDPANVIDRLDGLLVTGGNDIAPERYQATRESKTQPPEPVRDDHEFAVLDAAARLGLPTLGICRGLQLINVHRGGTLVQHVPEHAGTDQPATRLHHDVTLEPESTLGAIYGEQRPVNSLHHQAASNIGNNLRVTARSADGGIEGIEATDAPIIAVQWHPEMLPTAPTDPIFGWLVDQASAA